MINWLLQAGHLDYPDEGDTGEWSHPTPKTCKHCGQTGLQWKELKQGWRLHYFDTKQLKLIQHVCKK